MKDFCMFRDLLYLLYGCEGTILMKDFNYALCRFEISQLRKTLNLDNCELTYSFTSYERL